MAACCLETIFLGKSSGTLYDVFPSFSCRRETGDGTIVGMTADPNSRLGLLAAGYEKTLAELLTQIITFWRVRRLAQPSLTL